MTPHDLRPTETPADMLLNDYATETEAYALWLSYSDRGGWMSFRNYAAGLVELADAVRAAIAWAQAGGESIERAPGYGEILRLRVELKLPAAVA